MSRQAASVGLLVAAVVACVLGGYDLAQGAVTAGVILLVFGCVCAWAASFIRE